MAVAVAVAVVVMRAGACARRRGECSERAAAAAEESRRISSSVAMQVTAARCASGSTAGRAISAADASHLRVQALSVRREISLAGNAHRAQRLVDSGEHVADVLARSCSRRCSCRCRSRRRSCSTATGSKR